MKNVGGLIGSWFRENKPSINKFKSIINLFKILYSIRLNKMTNTIINKFEIIYGISNDLIFLLSKLFFFAEYSKYKNPDIIDNIAVPYVGITSNTM